VPRGVETDSRSVKIERKDDARGEQQQRICIHRTDQNGTVRGIFNGVVRDV
jgi:hypothetical protein